MATEGELMDTQHDFLRTPTTYCDVCGRRDSWGCGHSSAQRAAARRHKKTKAHREGRCWHYDHSECEPATCPERAKVVHWHPPAGYMPFVSHREAMNVDNEGGDR